MIASDRIPLKDAAQGRWKGILSAVGLSSKALSGKHGPCPLCGQGKDRFRFDDKEGRGTWICSACGAGDGIELVKRVRGVDFKAAAAIIEPLIGEAPIAPMKRGFTDADYRRMRRQAWNGARVVKSGDPVALYLHRRLGHFEVPTCLRFHPDLTHRDEDGRETRHAAMLAIVRGPDGKPANIHRTYLSVDGQKAAVEPCRQMMPGSLPDGAAIRLGEPAVAMGVAEGIETALAASILFGMPVWAAVSAGMMEKWQPPSEAKHVFVFGDNDAGYRGQEAAYTLARSISARRIAQAEVRIPKRVGADWADVLASRISDEAQAEDAA